MALLAQVSTQKLITNMIQANSISVNGEAIPALGQLTSTVQGLGTAGYISSASLASSLISTINFVSLSFSSFSTAFGPGGGGGDPAFPSSISTLYGTSFTTSNLTASSITNGVGRFITLSSLQLNLSSINGAPVGGLIDIPELTSTVAGLGSSRYLSSIPTQLSTTQFFTSSILASSITTSSLQVDSLTIGTGTGWLNLGPLQTVAISSIQTNVNDAYMNNMYVGIQSTANEIQFNGLFGNYNNTVLAEISTGAGTQEFLVFKGSSTTDRIRFQTTGNIRFEPGVSARLFNVNTTTTQSNAIPAMIITTASNVGIQCNAPSFTLDVNGSFQTIGGNTFNNTITTQRRTGTLGTGVSQGYTVTWNNDTVTTSTIQTFLYRGNDTFLTSIQSINLQNGNQTFPTRVGVGGAPTFGLDVVNGNFRVCSNAAQVGVQISSSANSYPLIQMAGGNSFGFIWGAFNGWKPNGGDGLNLSYNFYNDDSATFPSQAGNRIPSLGGQTSFMRLGYGEILLGTSTVGAPPQVRMLINQTGNIGINCNAPTTALDVNGTIQGLRLSSFQTQTSSLMIGLPNSAFPLDVNGTIQSLSNNILRTAFFYDYASHPFSNNYFYLQNFTSTLQVGLSNYGGALFINYSGGTANSIPRVGINTAPSYTLHVNGLAQISTLRFPATIGRKLVLWANSDANALAGEYYGIEISSGTIRNNIDLSTHQFQWGANPGGVFQEWARMTNRNLQISTTTVSSVTFGTTTGWVRTNAMQGIVFSSIQTNTALGYVSSLLVGTPSTNAFQVPAFNLQLVQNSALKPVNNLWTIGSDLRIKENITDANLDRCYDDIRAVKLRRFAWRKDYYDDVMATDRHVLGFLAQEVSTIVPKAVEVKSAFGYPDFQFLNIDQLNMSLYGAVKRVIDDKEILESTVKGQNIQIETLLGTQTFILSTLNGLQGR